MCVRYKNEKTNLGQWAARSNFSGFEDVVILDDEHFPGSKTGFIAAQSDQERCLTPACWGLIPPWAKDPAFGKKNCYNARSETISIKPSFRDPFRFRRCLIPATSFFERHNGRWLKFFTKDQTIFAAAGVYELPNSLCSHISYSMVTCDPNAFVSEVHDRAPVVLNAEDAEVWLLETSSEKELKALLRPFPDNLFMYEDSGPVGNQKIKHD